MKKQLSSSPVFFSIILTGIVNLFPSPATAETPLYKNPDAALEARVTDLLERMTLEKKIIQITTIWSGKKALLDSNGKFDAARALTLHPNGIGHFARPSDLRSGSSPAESPYLDERWTSG